VSDVSVVSQLLDRSISIADVLAAHSMRRPLIRARFISSNLAIELIVSKFEVGGTDACLLP
jgi:hypothetical protein